MLREILRNIPTVKKPIRKLGFNEKLKWTLIILLVYFTLGQIPLFGLDPRWTTDYFQAVRAIIAGQFGSIITLGIGPIVTAGIILQLLVGVKLLPLNLSNPEDRQTYQALSQLLVIAVTIFESLVYVFMGGLPPVQNTIDFKLLLVAQLFLGTMLIVLLDEVSEKWGFISGISLFIAAGVASEIMVAALNPFAAPGGVLPAGRIPAALVLLSQAQPAEALIVLVPIIFTVLVFLIAVYAQAINVEIPLSFGRVGGLATRWPLNLFYTGNIPVILTAALIANVQLWARLLQNMGLPLLGIIGTDNVPVSGIVRFITPPRNFIIQILNPVAFVNGLVGDINTLIVGSPLGPVNFYNLVYLTLILNALIYLIFMVAGSVVFSIFWVKTANQDVKSVARQINDSGMQVRGFRSDPRVLEMILERYIPQLTVIGGAAVGLLAAFADFTNSIGGGTGILLTVMIIYRLYQVIARQHMMEMNPVVRRFVEA